MSNVIVVQTFSKRFLFEGFLFLSTRAYQVGMDRGMELCQMTDNDLPMFKMVKEEQLDDGMAIIDLTTKEESSTKEKSKKPKVKKTVAKKATVKKKPSIKKKATTTKTEEPLDEV